MTEHLNELIDGMMGRGLQTLALGFEFDSRVLNAIVTDKFGSVTLLEASAAKELAKAGMGTDVAALNTGVATPRGDVVVHPPK